MYQQQGTIDLFFVMILFDDICKNKKMSWATQQYMHIELWQIHCPQMSLWPADKM